MDIVKIFETLSLKEDHAKLYMANLEWGETSITNLAERSGIPRSTAYPFIDDLVELGILRKSLKRNKKNYIPADPEFLSDLLKRKQKEIQDLNLEFNESMDSFKLYMNKGNNKPKLTYLEGSEGIKQAYSMTMEAEEMKEEIWIQCLTEEYRDVVSDEFFDKYFKRFFSSKIKSKEILTKNDQDYINKNGSAKNLQLMTNSDQRPTETDFMVYGNKVIFVSFNKDNPYALVIEDKEIAYCVKNMYKLAWKEAGNSDPRVLEGEEIKTEF